MESDSAEARSGFVVLKASMTSLNKAEKCFQDPKNIFGQSIAPPCVFIISSCFCTTLNSSIVRLLTLTEAKRDGKVGCSLGFRSISVLVFFVVVHWTPPSLVLHDRVTSTRELCSDVQAKMERCQRCKSSETSSRIKSRDEAGTKRPLREILSRT